MTVRFVGTYSEIFLKKGRRNYFLSVMGNNIRLAIRDMKGSRVTLPYGRVLVEVPDRTPEEVLVRLNRVFGITSWALVDVLDRHDDETPDKLLERVGARVIARAETAQKAGAKTFRISARRADKTFPMRSDQIAPEMGAAVLRSGLDLSVQLKGADVDIRVEIRADQIFVSSDRTPGPGGLPVSSNGKALLLLSGGIDSPVAGWLTLKRGVRTDAVTFDSFPLTGPQVQEKVRALARVLCRWSPALTLSFVPFADLQLMFRKKTPDSLLLLLYRRSMIRIAERVRKGGKGLVLVTGESLGQVASQTLANMSAIEAVTPIPILRPLITYDKIEIIRKAEELETYDISIRPHQDCCSLFVPPHPELKGRASFLEHLESKLEDLEALEDAAFQARTVFRFPAYGIGEIKELKP